jgi:septum site-determining protein MinC
VAQAPAFFENAPVVIDLEDVSSRPLDLAGLLKVIRSHGMVPAGLRGGSDATRREAQDIGLPQLVGNTVRSTGEGAEAALLASEQLAPIAELTPAQAPEPAPEAAPQAPAEPVEPAVNPVPPIAIGKLVTAPVRGGQQLYAQGSDLVLVAAVNQGAEVLADGHVHVYGPLRGRALAGARGDRSARIFTTCLEAELLSIAGIYQVIDDKLAEHLHGKPAQIYLQGDSLKIEPLL